MSIDFIVNQTLLQLFKMNLQLDGNDVENILNFIINYSPRDEINSYLKGKEDKLFVHIYMYIKLIHSVLKLQDKMIIYMSSPSCNREFKIIPEYIYAKANEHNKTTIELMNSTKTVEKIFLDYVLNRTDCNNTNMSKIIDLRDNVNMDERLFKLLNNNV